ncbi:MAG: glucosaminidase domain-containing protein [Lactobacillaceae bacterium]|jgi:mannosyl-glycoprotein endo-beta-N-acetylglucosaminidase|nr:glucosaminidase domain-containing protein [Lactobacillaceae bacterium]
MKISSAVQTDQANTKVLASLTLAQAALESDWGRSQLAAKWNNYFGVKTSTDDEDKFVLLPTKEYLDGKWVTIKDKFAVYKTPLESIEAHSKLFLEGTTWNKDQYVDVINAKNYKDAAIGLVKDGYATDPQYAEKIISVIEKYHFNIYDK